LGKNCFGSFEFYPVRVLKDNIYIYLRGSDRIGELNFERDRLSIMIPEWAPSTPEINILTQVEAFGLDYYNYDSFNMEKIIEAVDKIIFVAAYMKADDSLKMLLEDDRYLSFMTAIIDVNSIPVSREIFDKFINSFKLSTPQRFCKQYIDAINSYFKLSEKIKCDNLPNINVTYPCLLLYSSSKTAASSR
jgi:hypothetical protein